MRKTTPAMTLSAFIAAHLQDGAVLATLTGTEGSTPREAGATMVVSLAASAGSIGGGQLEFHCIDVARGMLARAEARRELNLPLGPQMGQCCGGRVSVVLERATPAHRAALACDEQAGLDRRPLVFIFGAGHTGRALARSLALLPLAVTLIDDRAGQFDELPAAIACLRQDDPGEALGRAPAGAAFVILTHSHALDYRLAEAALLRLDAAYVGMIGSATKRARFEQSFRRRHPASPALPRLTCPIGGAAVDDKRPEVIAALTAAELVRSLLGSRAAASEGGARGEAGTRSGHDAAA